MAGLSVTAAAGWMLQPGIIALLGDETTKNAVKVLVDASLRATWISVKDGLPPDPYREYKDPDDGTTHISFDSRYLVTIDSGGIVTTMDAIWRHEDDGECRWVFYGDYQGYNVTAWMLMPEPYDARKRG